MMLTGPTACKQCPIYLFIMVTHLLCPALVIGLESGNSGLKGK